MERGAGLNFLKPDLPRFSFMVSRNDTLERALEGRGVVAFKVVEMSLSDLNISI